MKKLIILFLLSIPLFTQAQDISVNVSKADGKHVLDAVGETLRQEKNLVVLVNGVEHFVYYSQDKDDQYKYTLSVPLHGIEMRWLSPDILPKAFSHMAYRYSVFKIH